MPPGTQRWVVAKKMKEKKQHETAYSEHQKAALRAYLLSIGKTKSIARILDNRMLENVRANDNADARAFFQQLIAEGGRILKKRKQRDA